MCKKPYPKQTGSHTIIGFLAIAFTLCILVLPIDNSKTFAFYGTLVSLYCFGMSVAYYHVWFLEFQRAVVEKTLKHFEILTTKRGNTS